MEINIKHKIFDDPKYCTNGKIDDGYQECPQLSRNQTRLSCRIFPWEWTLVTEKRGIINKCPQCKTLYREGTEDKTKVVCDDIYGALETFCIYPNAIKHSDGSITERSEYKNGWNKAVMDISDKILPIIGPYIDETGK